MRRVIRIEQIFEGWSPSRMFNRAGEFLGSVGIDPDMPLSDNASDIKTGGAIRPVKYEEFSGANVTSYPVAIITNPKNSNVYTVLRNGRLISYNSSLASESLIGTVTGSQASHAFYYNNYIYIIGTGSSQDDVARYGPLDGSPSLTNGVWKGATLGTQTALVNTTYPTTRHSVPYLNHFGFVHVDNKAYFCDYKQGIGYVHFIKTTRVTNEGDTNDGSTYGALDLPFGFLPMAGCSYGTDIAVVANETTNSTVNQGKAKLFLWNTVDDSFYRAVPLLDPIVSAVWYENGVLYGISGNLAGGVRLWRYRGGDSVDTLKYIEEGHPPVQSAVTSFGNRLIWGGFGTWPANYAGLMAYGSKSDLFPRGLHNIAVSSLSVSASNGLITAVSQALQGAAAPSFVMGGYDGTNYNLDKKSTSYGTHVFRSGLFRIGRKFSIVALRLPLTAAIAANMTITPKFYFDHGATSKTGTVINSTNYPNSDKVIYQGESDYENVGGHHNLELELTFSGTALVGVSLPIEIEIDDDEIEGI